MSNSLFRTKNISSILNEGTSDAHNANGLKRVLSAKDLTFFGIAAILGAGSFSSLGTAVFNGGPGVIILFVITAIACAFTAFCYSEFASRIPVAGSAYTYAYASFGELIAWVIGWALIMEYSIGNIYVAFSWSGYFTSFLDKTGASLGINLHIPDFLSMSYLEAKHAIQSGTTKPAILNAWQNAPLLGSQKIILDLPALVINFLITYLVYRGIKESRNFSNAMVLLKLFVVLLIIVVGGYLVVSNGLTSNWLPQNAKNVKSFMPNGFGGVMAAIASVFFAYIGFDAVSVLAEESKNPQKDLPKGMIYSLVICTVIYILLTLVLTGATNYQNFKDVADPLAFIFEDQNLNVGWMQILVSICAVVAMTSVLLVFQMGQPRIWMSMSRDGLLPNVFQKIHPRYKTPSFATIITGLVVGIPILFTDKSFVLDFTSIATLFAFVLVCGGVLLIPRRPKENGKFNLPYINAKFIFPAIILVTITILYFVPKKNYFADKLSFDVERRTDALKNLIPAQNFDTVQIANNLVSQLQKENEIDNTFKAVTDSIFVRQNAQEKFTYANNFLKATNTEYSRTIKIAEIIFWIIMIALSIFAFKKNYSLIPLLGVGTCLYLLTGMTLSNWIWFGAWLVLGLIVYFLYGYKKSKLAHT